MKARIKGTDSAFKEVTGIMVEGNVIYPIDRVEFDSKPKPTQGSIDLEQRRFELIKAVSSGIMANTEYYKVIRDVCPYLRDDANKEKELTTYDVMAIEVRKFADAVLAEYRKGENNEEDNV